VKHTITHGLPRATAIEVVNRAMNGYLERFQKYSAYFEWKREGYGELGFSAKGLHITGTVEVYEHTVDVDLTVPFLLRPFRGIAIEVVEEEVNKWVAKAKKGELDLPTQ
jgi:hypothetical protein